jgi:hypothetical protein
MRSLRETTFKLRTVLVIESLGTAAASAVTTIAQMGPGAFGT